MHTAKTPHRLRRIGSRGLSLVELLVSISLGLVVVTALIALYGNVSRSNAEMAKTNQLIENGRFAVQLLREDVGHAGFWGALDSTATVATAVPDACLAVAAWPTDAALLAAYKTNLVSIPVQAYADGSALATCGVAGVVANSDVLIVRHANTCTAGANCEGGTDTGPHLQISGCRSEAPPEPAFLIETKATLDARPTKIRNKDCATEAGRRKMVINAYYVALSNGVPTLMRVSFTNGAFAAPQPLIDGIEGFQVELGIDNLGSNGLAISATNPADGNADTYVSCAAAGCSLANLSNVVSVKLHVLARNLEQTVGYTDGKTYTLGSLTYTPAAGEPQKYKRHVFTTTVRLVNPSSRREAP
jgi:type IV pilus assembly protein PilW